MLDIASNRIKKIENISHLTELQEFWVSGYTLGWMLLLLKWCLGAGCRERGRGRRPGALRRVRGAGTVSELGVGFVRRRHPGAKSQAPRYSRWETLELPNWELGRELVRSVWTCPTGEVGWVCAVRPPGLRRVFSDVWFWGVVSQSQ